jgi:uncharacterized protein DUF1707
MARTSTLRASDADRDTVAERLRAAAVEGRLEPDEFEERLHLALRARTYGDLRRLVADLPGRSAQWDRARRPVPVTALAVAIRVAAVLVMIAVIVTVVAVMVAWWMLWLLLLIVFRGRCYGWLRPRSKALPTSIGSFTIPNSRSHSAHFFRTSSRSWP